jgi:hypothetical protein
MKTEPENLTARQSLDIITAMIQEAKGNVRKNSVNFLMWGWVIFSANVGMYILTQLHYPHPYAVWAITLPAWVISIYKGVNARKMEHTVTHFDTISGALWICFGVCIFTLVAFGYKINYQLNPLILTISAMPTFVSGIILRFRPLMLGGVIFWIFGIAGFLVPRESQPLVGAAAILGGYLVPGYLLKNRKG